MIYAVIDTNVIVAAVLTHNPESPTVRIIDENLVKSVSRNSKHVGKNIDSFDNILKSLQYPIQIIVWGNYYGVFHFITLFQ